MTIRVFFLLALILFSASFLQVTRCESEAETEVVEGTDEGGDLGIVGEDVQDFGGGSFSPATGVDTVCVFPKNPSKVVLAGDQSELLVGMKNDGESTLNVIAIQATLHLPFDHRYLVQNLSTQGFNNATVPPSAQATFPYIFGVSKFLQPGTFDLVGSIIYEVEQQPYQSTFYNGTIEVTEPGGLFSCFVLELPLLAFLGSGFVIEFKICQRKPKGLRRQRLKLELEQQMPRWMNGWRELLMPSSPNQRRRSKGEIFQLVCNAVF